MESKDVKETGYRALRTQKEYLKLIFANMINRFGDSIDSIAFVWLVYEVTGSASWSAIIFGLNQLPTVLIQPFTGVIVERFRKKRLMAVTDFIRGGIVTALAVLYGMNLVNPWILVAFTISISTVEAFRVPAGTAFVPKILDRSLYEFGTGLNSGLSTVMQLTGVAAAGIILGIGGIKTAILIDALTYIISGLVILWIRCKETVKNDIKINVKDYTGLLKEGFSYIKGKKIIINFCILGFIVNGLIVPFNSLQTPMIVEVLGKDSGFLSFISICLFCGMGAGSLLFPYIIRKTGGTRLVIASGFGASLSYLCFPLAGLFRESFLTVSVFSFLGAFILGGSVGMLSGVLGAEFMKSVEEAYMARCSAIFNAIACAAIPAVSAIVSAVAAFCPVSLIFIACGLLSVILFICIMVVKMQFES